MSTYELYPVGTDVYENDFSVATAQKAFFEWIDELAAPPSPPSPAVSDFREPISTFDIFNGRGENGLTFTIRRRDGFRDHFDEVFKPKAINFLGGSAKEYLEAVNKKNPYGVRCEDRFLVHYGQCDKEGTPGSCRTVQREIACRAEDGEAKAEFQKRSDKFLIEPEKFSLMDEFISRRLERAGSE